MNTLKLTIHKRGEASAEKTVALPLTSLQISLSLLPADVKAFLQKEQIDLTGCRDLVKEKNLKGTLIEIETPDKKMTIAVE